MTRWIEAVNASEVVRSALATPGLKTLLAPSNTVVGSMDLTDDIVLSNMFNGNLTGATLIELCRIGAQITSLSGEAFNVNCTTTTDSTSRSRRQVTTIRISNSASETTLTLLDLPSEFGTVHGTNAVLLPASSASGTNDDKSAEWYDKLDEVQWALVVVGALLVLVFIVAMVLAARSRRDPQSNGAHVDNDGWQRSDDRRHDDDDFAVVDNALAELARVNSNRAKHYYPTDDVNPGGNAPRAGQSRPVGGRAQSTHYYPGPHMTDDSKPHRQLSGKRGKSARSSASRSKLETPQHPIFSNRDGENAADLSRSDSVWEPPRRPQYVDPVPSYRRREMPVTAVWEDNY